MTELELYFRYRCEKGLKKRGLDKSQKHKERLAYEISMISQMGFCGYFLIVSDLLTWSLEQGIPVGPGRGSAAGSLVAYCLEITHLDPLKYGLIFERFLNPARVTMPDVDMDFCELRREEVIEYVRQKYGNERVAHIGTFGSAKSKAAVRDITRVKGFDYLVGDNLAKQLLDPIEGKPQPLAMCYEKVPELAAIRNGGPSREKEILEWAEKLEDRKRSFSTHASGIVISNVPISKMVPLYPGKDGAVTTQFEMNTIEEVGLIKFDFLGLRALTTIERARVLIAQRTGTKPNMLEIDLDDQEVYDLLCKGDTAGVFQLEGSSGIRDLLIQIQPRSLEDLALLVALYRPGPLGSEMLQHFLEVRKGRANPQFSTPRLQPILGPTGGMLIYQEQILEICKQLAGYTMAEADLMRKAVGKKKEKEMAAQEQKFKKGIVDGGLDEGIANRLWDDIKTFAAYGFNKSHAVCYGYISYQMAWLKTHYPLEFLCACLTSDSDEVDKVIQYISYCRENGINILPPSVNYSQMDFSVSREDNSLRFGLGAIKNLGKPVEDIIRERDRSGLFADIIDFAKRVDLSKINRKKLESLVLAGAFDIEGTTRASLMAAIEEVMRYRDESDRYQKKLMTFQKRMDAYNVRMAEIEAYEQTKQGKKPARVKVPECPVEPAKPFVPTLPEMSRTTLLSWEKELLGFYITGHPLDLVKERAPHTIGLVKEEGQARQRFRMVAIPSIIKEITTKKTKKKMAYVTLEDRTGTIEATVLPKYFEAFGKLIDVKTPAMFEGDVELTENEDGRIVKLMVSSVRDLPSIQQLVEAPLNVIVPTSALPKVTRFIAANLGEGCQIHLKMRGVANTVWDIGVYTCKGKREEVEKELKGLY